MNWLSKEGKYTNLIVTDGSLDSITLSQYFVVAVMPMSWMRLGQ